MSQGRIFFVILLRYVVAALVGGAMSWLVSHGVFTEEQASTFTASAVEWAVTIGGPLLLAVMAQYAARQKWFVIEAARQLPSDAPMHEVEQRAVDMARQTPFVSTPKSTIGVVLAIVLLSPSCAMKSAPVVVAQASLGVAQSIAQLQTSAEQLQRAGIVDAKTALRIQERLLSVNTQVANLVPYLRAVDRLQQSGVAPTKTEVDALISQVILAMQDLALVGVDVPTSTTTVAFFELLRTTQTTVTTTMIELARLRVALER